MNTIPEQLTEVYLSPAEWWHNKKLEREESDKYHAEMIRRGNIIYSENEDGRLLGYCQFLRVNYEQWGRIVCGAPFNESDEDTLNGNICVVHNTWIHQDYRNSFVAKDLSRQFFEKNQHCDYFVGHAKRKKTQPIKVFTRIGIQHLINRMIKLESGVI